VISQATVDNQNVVHLLYLAAYVPDVGESLNSMSRTMPEAPSALTGASQTDGEFGAIDPDAARDVFYALCDPVAATVNIARLDRQPSVTFTQTATHALWRDLPSTYVVCTKDNAVPPTHQRLTAVRCSNVVSLPTDHSPFASMPVETAEIIARITRG